MPDVDKADADPTPPPNPTEDAGSNPYYDERRLASRIAEAQIEAAAKQEEYGDTTSEERVAALNAAASRLKGTCAPPDVDAILRKIAGMSATLDELVARPRATSGISIKSMAFHMAIIAEGLIINMLASGLYELLKSHWSYLMTLTMSGVKDSPDAISAAENHARVTANMPRDAATGVLPRLDPIAYRMFLRQIRTDRELDRLLKSMRPIEATLIKRRLFNKLSILIATDGRL